MHEIKCERCGNDIDRSQLYIVIFHGVTLDVHTQHLCCKQCLKDLEKDLRATFTPEILNKCLSCYHLEIINDICEKEGEQKMTPAAIKYKDKLEELQMCINELAENNKLFGYDTFIEILKLQLDVSRELYRSECEDV